MASEQRRWGALPRLEDMLWALDCLHRANGYLRSQFSYAMTRTEAEAHFQARQILIAIESDVLLEMLNNYGA